MPVTTVRQTLHMYQGATYQHRWRYLDEDDNVIDLTGYTVRLQVREGTDSDTALIDATTENGLIVTDTINGVIDLIVPAADTTVLDFDCGVFDLELVHPDTITVSKLAYGNVKMTREITR